MVCSRCSVLRICSLEDLLASLSNSIQAHWEAAAYSGQRVDSSWWTAHGSIHVYVCCRNERRRISMWSYSGNGAIMVRALCKMTACFGRLPVSKVIMETWSTWLWRFGIGKRWAACFAEWDLCHGCLGTNVALDDCISQQKAYLDADYSRTLVSEARATRRSLASTLCR